jgi:uncharacterized protein YjiS (DUF1127 family)
MLTAEFWSAGVAAADTIGGSGSESGTTVTSAAAISENAFTAPDGTTFDPGSDGYDPVSPLFGDAPILKIGGGMLDLGSGPYSLFTENLEVYDSSGADVGSVYAGVNVSNVLGIETAQFTVGSDFGTAYGSPEAISSALSSTAFSGNANVTLSDLASALHGHPGFSGHLTGVDLNGGDVSADDVINAVANSNLSDDQLSDLGFTPGTFGNLNFDPDDVASGITFDPSQIAADLNSSDILSEFPANESTYSITNLGSGFANVYEATPNADGTAAASISDTLVTPFGNFDLSTPFDAIAQPDPGDAADGVDASSAGGSGSAGGASEHAFTISDGMTFDPGSDGYDPVSPTLFGVAPLLKLGGANSELIGQLPNATQDLEVYGNGAEAADIGSVDTQVTTANILGIEAAQFTVSGAHGSAAAISSALSSAAFSGNADVTQTDLASALTGVDLNGGDVTEDDVINALLNSDLSDDQLRDLGLNAVLPIFNPDDVASGITFDPSQVASDLNSSDTLSELPADESTYSITNLGSGFANVYEATPNADGTAAASISDTLVTPFGNVDLSTPFDAIAHLDPGDAADGVDASSAGGDGGSGSLGGPSEHAFTISDGTTFDPGSDGYDPINRTVFGVAPLLKIAGGNLGLPFFTQDLEVYDGNGADATDIGTVTTDVEASNVLGIIDSAQFTVTEAHGSPEAISSALSSAAFSGNADVSQADLASALADPGGPSLTGDLSAQDVVTGIAYSYLLSDEQLSDLGISSDGFGNYSFNADDVADGITFDPSQVASDLNSSDIFSDLQTDSTYSITNLTSGFMGDLLGGNIYNVYEAIPGDADDGSDASIIDILVTPFGNVDLSTPFNAIADLMPGDAAGGVDGSVGGGLFSGLGDLFSGGDSGAETGGLVGDAGMSLFG